MLTLTPLPRGEADGAYREFFTPAYFTQRLGQPGHWQGEGATGLGLANPVEPGVLQHLLAGRTPDGSRPMIPPPAPPDRPAGWCLELDLGGWRHGRPVSPEILPGGVFACFQSRATWDQMPQLSIRAVIPNVGLLREGTVTEFGLAQWRERTAELAHAYRALLGGELQHRLGAFQEWANTDLRLVGVPSALCAKFYFDPKARQELTDENGRPVAVLRSSELFGAWRRLGDKYRWGGKEAEALLGQMKRRQAWHNVVREWDQTLRRAGACSARVAQSIKRSVSRPAPSRTPRPSRKSRDKDMGHSH